MKKYEHREFIAANSLTDTSFSKPLQNQIRSFNKLLTLSEETVGEDREKLQQSLDALDTEILEEMINEYEDQLENNDIEEEDEVKETEEVKEPEGIKESEENVNEPLEEVEEIEEEVKEEEEKETETPDEQILGRFLSRGTVRLSDLRHAGFSANLSGSRTTVGKYLLERSSVFSYEYRISKQQE